MSADGQCQRGGVKLEELTRLERKNMAKNEKVLKLTKNAMYLFGICIAST